MAQIAETPPPSPTALIYPFPPTAAARRRLDDFLRTRVQPHAVDLTHAVPADADAIDALRRHTCATIAARTQADRTELVAALLMQMEAHPLAPCHAWPSRDIGGHPFVHVVVAGVPFRLLPDDCRTAATALIAEQAFPGCVGVAGDLREAANVAEARLPRDSGRTRALSPAVVRLERLLSSSPATSLLPANPVRRGVTGWATTVGLALIILCAAALSAWSGH